MVFGPSEKVGRLPPQHAVKLSVYRLLNNLIFPYLIRFQFRLTIHAAKQTLEPATERISGDVARNVRSSQFTGTTGNNSFRMAQFKNALIPVCQQQIRAEHVFVHGEVHPPCPTQNRQKRVKKRIGRVETLAVFASPQQPQPVGLAVDTPIGQLFMQERREVVFPGVPNSDVI